MRAQLIPDTSVSDRYDAEIDLDELNSHTRVLRLVAGGSRVLDLGCATGALGALLVAKGCHVVGVEVDAEAAAVARTRLHAVHELDLASGSLVSALGDERFDVVVAADVLEHLAAPHDLLAQVHSLLAPGGVLVTSIPNVAHGSVRFALLEGRFPYQNTGLLDVTHLRFFTRASMTSLFEGCGFHLVYVEDNVMPWEYGEVVAGVDVDRLGPEVRAAVDADPESQVYQFIAVSTPEKPDGLVAALARQGTENAASQALEATRAESSERGIRVAELEAQVLQYTERAAELSRDRDSLVAQVQELESRAAKFVEVLVAAGAVQAELATLRTELHGTQRRLVDAQRDKDRIRDSAAEVTTRLRAELALSSELRRRATEWENRSHEAAADARAARSSLRWRIGGVFVAPLSWLRAHVRKRG